MGIDVSVLFIPLSLTDEDLARSTSDALGTPGDLALIIVDQETGPHELRARFPRDTAISVWGEQDSDDWDGLARTISKAVEEKLVAFTVADHSCVGLWQVLESGVVVDGGTPSSYLDAPREGFKAAYGLDLGSSQLHAESMSIAAQKGLCLATTSPGMRTGALSAEQVTMIVATSCPSPRGPCP